MPQSRVGLIWCGGGGRVEILEGDGGAPADDSGGAVSVRSATNSETTKITIKPRGDRSWWDPFVSS
jgi:hypothetical protein